MKILVVGQYFYPENFRINNIVEELVLLGNDVTVLTGYPNYPEGEFFDGYSPKLPYDDNYKGAKIVRVKMNPRKSGKVNLAINYLSYWCSANKWIRKNGMNFDVTYSCEISPVFASFPCIKAKKKFGIPAVINVQDIWPECFEEVMGVHSKLIIKPLELVSNYLYKNADKLLCSSNSFVENFEKRGIDENKLVFWPQYSNEYEIDNLECPLEYKTKYRFVFAGNIGDAQGLDVIIDCAKITLKNPQIGYYLVGDGSDKERLMKIAKENNLSNITFIDRMPEVEVVKYITNATASLLVLKNGKLAEMFLPAKLQMYMACGSPIISAINGEAGKIVNDAQCGVVCNSNTGIDLSYAVQKFVDNEIDVEIAKNNCKKYNDNHFNKGRLIDSLNAVLLEKCKS